VFDDVNSATISTEASNAPNLSFTATPLLGNMNFNLLAPPTKGEVQPGFPSFEYISLEALIFFQGMINPQSAPYTTLPGSNTGQQVISGQITQVDTTGTSRYAQGYQSAT
jgi:hypothetical protein